MVVKTVAPGRHPGSFQMADTASRPSITAASYDRLADEYAARIYDELANKPLDRELLDRFARELGAAGTVCDLGCGPGHVARFLRERGANVVGMDLSAGMVGKARALNPDVVFEVGDMLALPVKDEAWSGIAAFYSIIHIPPGRVVDALSEMWRSLQPGGLLLVAFHVGEEIRHVEELWEVAVNLDFHFFSVELMAAWMRQAGFVVEDVIRRDPYPEVEVQTQRAYVFARRPL
jgi:SAM-dependent methyltransferase